MSTLLDTILYYEQLTGIVLSVAILAYFAFYFKNWKRR